MKRIFLLIGMLLLTGMSVFAAEFIHNGTFLDIDYDAKVHRHIIQPYWRVHPRVYSACKLLKDVEADVAKSHLNIKCLKAPAGGFKTMTLETDFVSIPHSPVKITWRARGNGNLAVYVFEYLLDEKGQKVWLGRAASFKPTAVTAQWKNYSLEYTPRQGELGSVMLRFNFTPAKGESLDIDLTDVSATGNSVERSGIPATFVIPKLAKTPDLSKPEGWSEALHLTGFKDNFSNLPEAGRTHVLAGYDDKNLYLGFVVKSDEAPVAKFTRRDSTVYRDDSVEAVFTDMDDNAYAHFIINCLNGIYDRNKRDDHTVSWSPNLQSAAGSTEKEWWAALSIPREGFPFALQEGNPFKLNFLQTDITEKGGHKVLYLSWSRACEKNSNVTADNTALYPQAVLSPVLISAGMEVASTGELKLNLVNPGEPAVIFVEYGSAKLHKGTVKLMAPKGQSKFKIPYIPNNELAVIAVRDASGRELYRNEEIFTHRLETHLGLKKYLPLNYVELTSDINSLPEYKLEWGIENGPKGLFEVKGKPKNLRIDITSLPLETPRNLTVTIIGPGGTSLGTRQFTIIRPKREPWTGTKLGITDQPLPPFTPIRQTKDGLSFLMTEMQFNGRALPAAMSSEKKPLLSGPVRLFLDGKDIADATRRSITSVKPNRIEWKAENGVCRWTGWAEEDGFTWYTVTLKANPKTTVNNLYLDIPVRPEYAKILNPYPVFRSGGDMDGRWRYDGKEWTSLDFKQLFTLRDEYRGVELTAEDERDCVRKSVEGSHRLFMKDGHAVIRMTFIDKPVRLERERTFRFGLQAFPTKPLVRPPDYLATASYVDPRTAAWSGSLDKATIRVTGLKGPVSTGTIEWSAFWNFDPAYVHPDYHVRPFMLQALLTFGNIALSYNPETGFSLMQAGKTYASSLPKPTLAKGWHHSAITWKDRIFTLWVDGDKAAEFTVDKRLLSYTFINFGKGAPERHADFHYEALKVSRVILPKEQMGNFGPTPEMLYLVRFTPEEKEKFALTGDVREVKTDRGVFLSTASEDFTRLDALEHAGFKSSLAYLNRIFMFYGPRPNGYRNRPYTNEEGYKAFGILCDDMKARGMKIYFGYSFGVCVDSHEDQFYRDFYCVQPAKLYGSTTAGFWYFCAGCQDYHDFLTYYFSDLMDRYDNLGIYTDNLFLCGRLCKNEAHGCGYHDQDDHDELKLSGNLLNGRALAKRIYAITKLRPVPREHFMHSSGQNHAVFLSWADKYLCGEQYLENTDKKGWNIDLAQFRAQNDVTRAFGVPSNAISTFVPFRHKGMLAVAGLHDISTYGAHHHRFAEDVFGYKPFLLATTRFGTWQAQFIPYYDNKGLILTDATKQHYASGWLRKGRLLVQASNLNWEDGDVSVKLDMAKLGLKGRATDAVSGKPVNIKDGTLTLPVPAYDARLILVE